MAEAKPFDISKRDVWEAFKKVKANHGAAGVDGQSIQDFEADLSNNLYKLWNRLSSGSYFPPPVQRVVIPKPGGGGDRALGVPTVADRCAQEVAKRYLEPLLEPIFHENSYGYRPGRSAIDAVRTARQRCWRYDWVLDLDVQSYFDSIDWELMLKAVRHYTDCPWVLLYIEHWLKAPVQMGDGSIVARCAGTPWHGHQHVVSFLPGVSPKALKAMGQTLRRWCLHHRSDKSLQDLAQLYNGYIRGGINYDRHFYGSALHPFLRRIDAYLARWACRKFTRLHQRPKRALDWLARVRRTNPNLFAHWRFMYANG